MPLPVRLLALLPTVGYLATDARVEQGGGLAGDNSLT